MTGFVQGDYVESINKGAREQPPRLSRHEEEVLAHIAEGHSNEQIAAPLGVGGRTVETHRENLIRKLGISTAVGLTRYAISQGFIILDAPRKRRARRGGAG